MATYAKGIESKKQLVMLTYEKLCNHDASEITVRDIAKEKGCSAAAIYRHFENMEYLIVIASARFLHEYMLQYAKLMDDEELPYIEMYLRGWELFNHYAFERPDIYYRLFWGNENRVFTDALQDYFELFPFGGSEKYMAYFYTLMFNDNVEARDLFMLKRAVNYHLMREEDAVYFSKTNPLIVKGLLLDSMNQSLEERKEMEKICNGLIRKNMEKIVK